MKVREGFVSNSSSSSFVLRGIEIKEKELAKIWDIDTKSEDLFELLYSEAHKRKLMIESTRDYFDGEPTGKVVIGKDLGELPDGVVVGLKTPNDVDIKNLLKTNNIPSKELTTFVQYVSNDNY